MKQTNFKKTFLAILVLLITFSTLSFAKPVEKNEATSSTEIQPKTVENNKPEKTINQDDIFLTGTTVVLDQETHGNVYLIGANSVTVSAPIYGNIFIFSSTVDFKIENSQEPVHISGSAYIYGNDINLNISCQDLYAYANKSLTINNNSTISRDIRGCTTSFNLYGIVERNVFIDTENISFSNENNEKGLIKGNLSYYNTTSISIPEESVAGELFFNQQTVNNTPIWLSNLYITIVRTICCILFFFILRRIIPTVVKPEKGFILKKFLETCLSSILTLLIVPALCIFLIYCWSRLSLFAIPIMFIYAGLIIISFFTSIIYISGLIQRALKKYSLWISVGLLLALNIILYLISFITIVSLIFLVIFIIFGFGLLTQELFKKREVI